MEIGSTFDGSPFSAGGRANFSLVSTPLWRDLHRLIPRPLSPTLAHSYPYPFLPLSLLPAMDFKLEFLDPNTISVSRHVHLNVW